MKLHYFDYAAATPVSASVQALMQPYFADKFYNPSALYLSAQSIKQDITQARITVAELLGCKTSEIIFTGGGTESDNLAIKGIMEKYPDANCIVSSIEHDAVMEPAKRYKHKFAPVQEDGRVDISKLSKLIDEKTVLVSIMYANNEIGTIQPLRDIARELIKIREHRHMSGNDLPLYFHTDACQAANYLPLLINSLGVDMMTLNGGKIYGPKQSGILYVKTGLNLSPQILGGGQERGIRSGTENVPAIIGFAAALIETAQMQETEAIRLQVLQRDAINKLQEKLPQLVVNGTTKYRLPNNIHITIPGTDNETVMMRLDEAGMQVATGSACSASSDEPSHVLTALGLSEESARSSLRITLGRYSTQDDLLLLADTLSRLV